MTIKIRLEMKNRSHRYDIIDLRLDIDTHILNTNCILVSCWLYVLSNTQATFEAQFMKKLSNTEAEFKNSLLKKACIHYINKERKMLVVLH